MIDAHCHLNFKAFNKDYDGVIKRAFGAGVTKIINVGTKIDSSQKAVELGNQYENLYAVVGIHPHHSDKILSRHPERSEGSRDSSATPQNDIDWIKQLEVLAKHPKVVGIGECGLDFYRSRANEIVDPKLQKEVFVRQIELASKLKKPLQVHNRQAGKEILEILKAHKSSLLNPPGMFHCFSGDLDFLKKVLNLGFYVGFDGNITYQGLAPGGEIDLRELVKYTPRERLILETDSPYLAPFPFRGSRNEPRHVIIIAEFIAHILGSTVQGIEEVTEKNTHDVFFPKNIRPLSHQN